MSKPLPVHFGLPTLIALIVFIALVASFRFSAALFFAVGWSLGGDGAVFKQVWANARAGLKREA